MVDVRLRGSTPSEKTAWIGDVGSPGAKVLAEASGLLASSYDETPFIRDFVRFVVQDLADWVVIYLVEPDGKVSRAQGAHRDTTREPALRALLALPPLTPDLRGNPVIDVIASGRGVLRPDLTHALATDGRHRGILRELGDGNGVVAPLRARGRVLGALALCSTRQYHPSDVALAEALGRLAGLGIDNARLFFGEQSARRDAERAASRMARLQSVTATLAEALTEKAVADAAVNEGALASGALGAALCLVEHADVRVLASSTALVAGSAFPLRSPTPLADAIRTGRPSFGVPNANGDGRVSCAIPLVLQGRIEGGLLLEFHHPTEFSVEERTFIETLAGQCAHALERARLFAAEKRARTELEALVSALKESETRYKLLADHSLDMITRMTPDGTRLYVSPACRRLLGFEPDEMIGRPFDEGIHPEDAMRLRPSPANHLGDKDIYALTYRRRHKDGHWVWVEMTARGVRDAKGQIVEVVAVSRDITERKRGELEMEAGRRQVAQSEKLSALGSLVSGVAHEVRTPLAYLTNNIYLMLSRLERATRDGGDPKEVYEQSARLAREALEATERITTLVRDLGRFTRQPAGGRIRAPLDNVVGEAVRLWQATHRGQVVLESDLQPTPWIEVDPVQVQQVALNLLENAAEATRTAGSVRIRTRSDGDAAVLIVEDQGPGIPSEVQERMYDPFFTTKKEGTGLGLAIVKRIVEQHGAQIECDSRVGRGTTFRITFPPAGER